MVLCTRKVGPILQAVMHVIFILFALVATQDETVAASTGTSMTVAPPFIAVTPASALAPSSGNGPVITGVTRNPSPQPQEGQQIPITATVSGTATDVTLTYLVNYETEQAVQMTSSAEGQFTAIIPSSAFKRSNMVRWYVTATGSNQQSSRSPPLGEGDRYFGTVVADPSVNFKIPVMEWFTDQVTASANPSGANGSSVQFLGRFYDNIFVKRKGVTSLSWPKPKLKFKLADSDFVYKPVINKTAFERKIKTFDLNSLYYEPGQKSYMREAIAYQVLQEAGAVSAISYHLVLRLNGEFYGLYTYVENDDQRYLKRNGLSEEGVLIKPMGTAGNLGFGVPVTQLQYSFEQKNHENETFWPFLDAFINGIAGAGNETRSKFVFDYVELSETINTMAVLTMLLTQDRCTKNYLLYLDLNTTKWQMFAYDLKSALNADAGYPNGRPATDYCTLECEQWNSPLYCDRNHPQDVTTNLTTPWTFISAASIGRRLAQASSPSAAALVPDSGSGGINVNITKPDEDLVARGNAPQGSAATFNYLIDLITQVPATRQMYMRRLRTLTDQYYTTGKIQQMVTDMYNKIKEAADVDDQKWHIGNITLGYLQLVQEQIPKRKMQLLQMYGPGGATPLLPDAQPANASLAIGRMDASSPDAQQFLEIVNNNAFAVDVSRWMLAGAVQATLKSGTVIAGGNSLIVARDTAGFRRRTVPPTMGQGMQVIGELEGSPGAGSGIQLINDHGAVVATETSAGTALVG